MSDRVADLTLDLESIYAAEVSNKRVDVESPKSGTGNLQVETGSVDDDVLRRFCSLKLKLGGDEQPFFVYEALFRLTYAADLESLTVEDLARLEDRLDAESIRSSEPYHRQALADAMTRAGLPPLLLPPFKGSRWTESGANAESGGVS